MPQIDYAGDYRVFAKETSTKDSRGALRFPIKASTNQAARNFASKKILELLAGWDSGSVWLYRKNKVVDRYLLTR